MQADYAKYAKDHGVLPIPPGYNPQRQVLINSVLNYWLPAYGGIATLALLVLGALTGAWFWRKRAMRKL